jgi:hypothetical protein
MCLYVLSHHKATHTLNLVGAFTIAEGSCSPSRFLLLQLFYMNIILFVCLSLWKIKIINKTTGRGFCLCANIHREKQSQGEVFWLWWDVACGRLSAQWDLVMDFWEEDNAFPYFELNWQFSNDFELKFMRFSSMFSTGKFSLPMICAWGFAKSQRETKNR